MEDDPKTTVPPWCPQLGGPCPSACRPDRTCMPDEENETPRKVYERNRRDAIQILLISVAMTCALVGLIVVLT